MHERSDPIEIRSFRSVFELERRVYRIDRLRLNPAGIPIRSFVYFGVLAAVVVLMQALPLLGAIVERLPWYLRYGGLAALMASLLTIVQIDGRVPHVAALSLIGMVVGPRHLWRLGAGGRPGGRWEPPGVVFVPDGSQAGAMRLRYRGPGAVLVLARHRCRARSNGRRLRLLAVDGDPRSRPRVLALGAQTTVEVGRDRELSRR